MLHFASADRARCDRHLSAVPPGRRRRRSCYRDERRDDAVFSQVVNERDAGEGSEQRAEYGNPGEVGDSSKALYQRALAVGDQAQEDGNRQQRHRIRACVGAEGHGGKRSREQHQQERTERAENDGGAPQHDHRSRDSVRVPGAGRLGDLAHAAAVDAHLGHAARQVGDGAVHAHQSETRRPEQHGHRLRPHDADRHIQNRRAADENRRPENLTVRAPPTRRGQHRDGTR